VNKTIEDVQDLAIEEVIGRYMGTELKKSGASYKGKCPLPNHAEKSPSFYVTPAKGIFKCFGCGAGGDAIQFVMLHDNLSFLDAVRSIAQQHGIPIEERKGEVKSEEQKNEEEEMRMILDMAQKKYRSLL
jgi:DNA primase